jgi:hypothetical protein
LRRKIKLKENVAKISSKLESIGISKRVQGIVAILVIVSSICAIIGIDLLSLLPESNTSVEYTMIDSKPHHLGDVNNSILFPEAPNYEGQYYEKNFTLDYITEKMYILMKTRDIDPKIENGPARLRINNKCDYYLNMYVKEERYLVDGQVQNYAEIELPVNSNDFKVGTNKISISVSNEGEIFYYKGELYRLENVDDIEFWDLKVKLEGKKTKKCDYGE